MESCDSSPQEKLPQGLILADVSRRLQEELVVDAAHARRSVDRLVEDLERNDLAQRMTRARVCAWPQRRPLFTHSNAVYCQELRALLPTRHRRRLRTPSQYVR